MGEASRSLLKLIQLKCHVFHPTSEQTKASSLVSLEGPMSSFSQTFPASLRSRAGTAPESVPAPDRRPYLIPVPPRKPAASTRQYLSLFPHESEDARLTGATRSLYRRLLALNLPRPAASSLEPGSAPQEVKLPTVGAPKIA
jgi:hypothetical protein